MGTCSDVPRPPSLGFFKRPQPKSRPPPPEMHPCFPVRAGLRRQPSNPSRPVVLKQHNRRAVMIAVERRARRLGHDRETLDGTFIRRVTAIPNPGEHHRLINSRREQPRLLSLFVASARTAPFIPAVRNNQTAPTSEAFTMGPRGRNCFSARVERRRLPVLHRPLMKPRNQPPARGADMRHAVNHTDNRRIVSRADLLLQLEINRRLPRRFEKAGQHRVKFGPSLKVAIASAHAMILPTPDPRVESPRERLAFHTMFV